MKVSVITVVYNGANTIRNTIESVLSQENVAIEYIIIDGASTDGTLDIINEYSGHISKIESEPDKGIYDAMNKGIALATGDIVAFLNADDVYTHTNVLHKIVSAFKNNSKVSCIYGDIVMERSDGSVVRMWRSCPYKRHLFRSGWHPPHPAFFVKKQVYDTYGVFDTSFKIAADYELMLRLLEKINLEALYVSGICVRMRAGGVSNGSLRGIYQGNKETWRAWKRNGLRPPILLIPRKLLAKVKQLFVRHIHRNHEHA